MNNKPEEDSFERIPESAPEKAAGRVPFRIGFDARAAAEVKQASQGKSREQIENEAFAAEAKRSEAFRDHFERLAVFSLYLIWAVIVSIAITWLWHLLLPESYWWLTEQQIQHIQAVLTGGVIAGIASSHLKRRLSD